MARRAETEFASMSVVMKGHVFADMEPCSEVTKTLSILLTVKLSKIALFENNGVGRILQIYMATPCLTLTGRCTVELNARIAVPRVHINFVLTKNSRAFCFISFLRLLSGEQAKQEERSILDSNRRILRLHMT